MEQRIRQSVVDEAHSDIAAWWRGCKATWGRGVARDVVRAPRRSVACDGVVEFAPRCCVAGAGGPARRAARWIVSLSIATGWTGSPGIKVNEVNDILRDKFTCRSLIEAIEAKKQR